MAQDYEVKFSFANEICEFKTIVRADAFYEALRVAEISVEAKLSKDMFNKMYVAKVAKIFGTEN